jgi:hypothetical protein
MSTRLDDMCNEEPTDICNDGRRYVVFVWNNIKIAS